MKEQDDIDHLFRSEFDDFAVAPPASVKEAVDLSIAAARRKRFSRWFYIGLGVVVILFVTGISLLDNEQKDKHLAQAALENRSGNDSRSTSSKPGKSTVGSGNARVSKDSSILSDENKTNNTQRLSSDKNSSKQISESTNRTGSASRTKNKATKSKSDKSNIGFSTQSSSTGKNSSTHKKTTTRKGNKFKDRKPNQEKSLHSIADQGEIDSKKPSTDKGNGNSQPAGEGQGVIKEEKITAEEPEKTKTEVPLTENKTEKTIPKDSLTPYVEDDSTAFAKNEAKQKNDRKNIFLFSLKPGATIGFNQRADTSSMMELKEKSAFFIHGEASYFFTSRFAVTSGLNYESRKEELTQTITSMDSVIVGYDYEYLLDSLQNPIDSVAIPIYEVQSGTSTSQHSYRLYSIGLPLFFTYSKELGPKLNLDLSAGAIISLQGSRSLSDSPNTVVVNKFGAKACLRTQLRYQFSDWGVSLNTNFGYDLIPVNSWPGIDRKRTYLDLGVGIHYVIGK